MTNRRQLRKRLREDLRSGDYNTRWEAWRTIDSGAAGRSVVFLLWRCWDLIELSRLGTETGLGLLKP